MFIVIKSEHYDCTNLICKKDTLEEAVAAVKDSMPSRKYRRHLTPTMLGLPCSLAKTCRVLCAMAAIK